MLLNMPWPVSDMNSISVCVCVFLWMRSSILFLTVKPLFATALCMHHLFNMGMGPIMSSCIVRRIIYLLPFTDGAPLP